ncbi:MAG TPA: hypothetical protein VNJ12_00250 [Candidatus Dormibacteraeota bacterium]|nr:hypothetical protein [Candidatus Dormibacteraeota bacterium]
METAGANLNNPGGNASRERYQAALEPLRPGFQADGMDIVIGSINLPAVEVRVLMGPNACEECLLPPETLEKFFLAAIRHVDAGVERVEVTIDRSAAGDVGNQP